MKIGDKVLFVSNNGSYSINEYTITDIKSDNFVELLDKDGFKYIEKLDGNSAIVYRNSLDNQGYSEVIGAFVLVNEEKDHEIDDWIYNEIETFRIKQKFELKKFENYMNSVRDLLI